MLTTFVYGPLVRLEHGEPLLERRMAGSAGDRHLAVAQVIPSLVVRRGRDPGTTGDRVFLAAIVVLQSAGLTPPSWRCQDRPGLHHRSDRRSALVGSSSSWASGALRMEHREGELSGRTSSPLGCWVLGGLNYLTSPLGSEAVILAVTSHGRTRCSRRPRSTYLIPPVVVLYWPYRPRPTARGRDPEPQSPSALIFSLALSLIIIMFLMGFFISSAGNPVIGGV
jgi:hypothetical protein